jgi:Cys-Gly metallodipeptidase DUG1
MPLIPLRRITTLVGRNNSYLPSSSVFARGHQAFQFAGTCLKLPTYPLSPRRSYYGHISDHKMAPQLEPFFKQCVSFAKEEKLLEL